MMSRKDQALAIANEECERAGMRLDEVLSHRTGNKIHLVRWHIYDRLNRELNAGLSEIGRWMNRDHSAISHALKKARGDL